MVTVIVSCVVSCLTMFYIKIELWWSKTAVRDCGSREFTSINEATEFARLQFGIAVDAWCENK